eukprot:5538401-Amphidinium_carterae.1
MGKPIERNPESHSSPNALSFIRIDIAPQDLIRIQLRGSLLLVVLITSSLAGADAIVHTFTLANATDSHLSRGT